MKPRASVAIALILTLTLTSCGTDEFNEKAYRALERDGYQKIELQGYAWFGCGSDDTFRTKFVAIKNDQAVEGVVCGGWAKGLTIRTF